MSKPQPVLIRPGSNFDWSTITIGEPRKNPYDGAASKVYVKGENGEKRPIFIELAKHKAWGVSGRWKFGLNARKQTNKNIEGFQVSYPMTSRSSVKKPRDDERLTFAIFDAMRALTADAISNGFRKASSTTYDAYKKHKDDTILAVKPMYDYTKDKSKPQGAYLKFNTKGKGEKIKCKTRIYGTGVGEESPFDFMYDEDKPILMTAQIVLRWDDIYWGGHGTTGYGASMRVHVSEITLTPAEYDDDGDECSDESGDESSDESDDEYSFLSKKLDDDDDDEAQFKFKPIDELLNEEEEEAKHPVPAPRRKKT